MQTLHVAAYLRTSLPAALPPNLAHELSELMAPIIVDAVRDAESDQRQARRRASLAARRMMTGALAEYSRTNGSAPVELVGALYDAAAVCGEAASLLYDFCDRQTCLVAA